MTARCEHVRPDLGAYVLGGLEPGEEAAVREHLAGCAECAAEHATLAGLPRLLALAVAPADDGPPGPAPGVEERVLDAVAGERPRRAARRRRRRRPRVLLAAGGALAGLAAALAIALGGDGDGGREGAPAGYEVALRPVAGESAGGRARLASAEGGTTLRLWVEGLPADPAVVYEVRCDAPGWSASAGTFRADGRGRASVVLTTAARRGEYDAIRVVRRAGGRSTDVLQATL